MALCHFLGHFSQLEKTSVLIRTVCTADILIYHSRKHTGGLNYSKERVGFPVSDNESAGPPSAALINTPVSYDCATSQALFK